MHQWCTVLVRSLIYLYATVNNKICAAHHLASEIYFEFLFRVILLLKILFNGLQYLCIHSCMQLLWCARDPLSSLCKPFHHSSLWVAVRYSSFHFTSLFTVSLWVSGHEMCVGLYSFLLVWNNMLALFSLYSLHVLMLLVLRQEWHRASVYNLLQQFTKLLPSA